MRIIKRKLRLKKISLRSNGKSPNERNEAP
jgi:hypothetical protein